MEDDMALGAVEGQMLGADVVEQGQEEPVFDVRVPDEEQIRSLIGEVMRANPEVAKSLSDPEARSAFEKSILERIRTGLDGLSIVPREAMEDVLVDDPVPIFEEDLEPTPFDEAYENIVRFVVRDDAGDPDNYKDDWDYVVRYYIDSDEARDQEDVIDVLSKELSPFLGLPVPKIVDRLRILSNL